MSAHETQAQKIPLGRVVPTLLARRIYSLVQTDDAFEALVRLCSAGYVELANTLLFYIVASGESMVAFAPYPSSAKLVSCVCAVSEADGTMMVVNTIEHNGKRDHVCIAIDNFRDPENYFARPCTVSEIEEVVKELVSGGEARSSVEKVMV